MKKALTLITALAMLVTLAVSSSAKDIKFGVLEPSEEPHIVENSGGQVIEGTARFFDLATYIIYKFPLDAGDTHATISLPVTSGYELSVSTDYDETAKNGTWTVIGVQQNSDPNSDEWWER